MKKLRKSSVFKKPKNDCYKRFGDPVLSKIKRKATSVDNVPIKENKKEPEKIIKSSAEEWAPTLAKIAKISVDSSSREEEDSFDSLLENLEETKVSKEDYNLVLGLKVSLCQGKKHAESVPTTTLGDCIKHLGADPENSIRLNLAYCKLICVNIDDSRVGERLLSHLEGKLGDTVEFKTIFQQPLVVENQTANHVHLYYKIPPGITKPRKAS